MPVAYIRNVVRKINNKVDTKFQQSFRENINKKYVVLWRYNKTWLLFPEKFEK